MARPSDVMQHAKTILREQPGELVEVDRYYFKSMMREHDSITDENRELRRLLERAGIELKSTLGNDVPVYSGDGRGVFDFRVRLRDGRPIDEVFIQSGSELDPSWLIARCGAFSEDLKRYLRDEAEWE